MKLSYESLFCTPETGEIQEIKYWHQVEVCPLKLEGKNLEINKAQVLTIRKLCRHCMT